MEYIGSIMVILCVLSKMASSQWFPITPTQEPISYDVRLTDGPTAAEGLVEVSQSASGQWGTLCDYQVNIRIASVVCRQLGYDLAFGTDGALIHQSYGKTAIFSDIQCRGIESSLTQCFTVKTTYPISCQYAAVRCGNFSAEILPPKPVLSTEPFDIRLVDGPTSSEGRLEVHHQGIWGTVCDDGFELNEANVACQQLGYDYAVEAKDRAFYGQGDGNILLDDIDCFGNEKLLSRCIVKGWGSHDCSPSEDVGVRCGNLEDGELPISLTDSNSELGNRGNVQVFYNGSWGYICRSQSYGNYDTYIADDWGNKQSTAPGIWGTEEANVLCHQLGYEGGARSDSDYRVSYNSDINSVVSYIDCNGDESNLGQCKIKGVDLQAKLKYDYYADSCNYNQASVICRTQVEGGLSNGKIAGITVTCILIVIMLVVIPLVILRCKKPKTIESQTTEGQQQANGTTTTGMAPSGILSPADETTVMYMSSPTGPSQVMMPYGSPVSAYGQNGHILYPNQPLLFQQPSNSQPQSVVAPINPNGVQIASGTDSFTDIPNVSTQGNKLSSVTATGAAGGGRVGGLESNEHAVDDKKHLV